MEKLVQLRLQISELVSKKVRQAGVECQLSEKLFTLRAAGIDDTKLEEKLPVILVSLRDSR